MNFSDCDVNERVPSAVSCATVETSRICSQLDRADVLDQYQSSIHAARRRRDSRGRARKHTCEPCRRQTYIVHCGRLGSEFGSRIIRPHLTALDTYAVSGIFGVLPRVRYGRYVSVPHLVAIAARGNYVNGSDF